MHVFEKFFFSDSREENFSIEIGKRSECKIVKNSLVIKYPRKI